MNLLDRVMAVRTGGTVQRCHGIRHQGSYSVAEHTWGVLALLYLLYPDDYARLSPCVLFHDVPEAWVGDIPASTKKWNNVVKLAVSEMEARIMMWLQLPDEHELNASDHAKLKACDVLDLYLWVCEEVCGGNGHAKCVGRELDTFVQNGMKLPAPAHELWATIRQRIHGGYLGFQHETDDIIRRIHDAGI